ncbi:MULTISPECIES: hypothetical protein [Chelatococcus]|uniref:Signaling protein n=1 Tax=Chelatococcus caeni TaxID=1348468 RepID=A0A840C495_9HYPH|nr:MULTISPECIES: hypothetical protein [unclassified Chelatococcus]MBB4019663.1 hypothetical protein [Chelatococcus caeni]
MAEAQKARTSRTLVTLISVAVLVGTEVFAVAIAAGWAIAGIFELGQTVGYVLMGLFALVGLWAMVGFMRQAARAEGAHGAGGHKA